MTATEKKIQTTPLPETNSSKNLAIQHTFFLNIEQAYLEAEKQQKVFTEDQNEELQYCYYEGPLTDITLINFIKIDQSNFVEFFSNNQLPIPTLIIYENGQRIDLKKNSPDIIEDILNYRENLTIKRYIHKDTYFIDSLEALNTAKQRNRVPCLHPTIDGLQLCYYHGDPINTTLNNFIHLNFSDFIEFFCTSRLRMPELLATPSDLDKEIKLDLTESFLKAIDATHIEQKKIIQKLLEVARTIKPDFSESPLRVFFYTSHYTTVMQYSSKSVAKEFEKLGYKVHFYIDSEIEDFSKINFFKQYIAFKPHVVFNINFHEILFMHKDVVYFLWQQDPLPHVKNKVKVNLRERDFVYSAYKDFDPLLKECGIHRLERQGLCVDSEVFYDQKLPRKNKIVFVGSSYIDRLNSLDSTKEIVKILSSYFTNGKEITYEFVKQLSEKYDYDFYKIWHQLFNYVVRDTTVEWICQLKGIEVEIFGYYWNQNNIVKDNYKGIISHGKNLANLYNESKYALVSLPFEVNSQRLAEISACGCIPIVWDCRYHAELPHWDDNCLFFKTQNELELLFSQPTPEDLHEISRAYSYEIFVDKMDKVIKNFIQK